MTLLKGFFQNRCSPWFWEAKHSDTGWAKGHSTVAKRLIRLRDLGTASLSQGSREPGIPVHNIETVTSRGSNGSMGNGQGITQSERSTCLRIHQSSPARISDRDHVPGPQGCTERLPRLAPVLPGAAVFDSSAGNVPVPWNSIELLLGQVYKFFGKQTKPREEPQGGIRAHMSDDRRMMIELRTVREP
jgi:hypothetical protein